MHNLYFLTHIHPVYNNSYTDIQHMYTLMHISRWTQQISLNSFIKFVCFSARICLLCLEYASFKVCMSVDFFMLQTAADRDSQGEKATSIRVNAICEVRCVLDLSGPLSLSSISIYHHLPSQDHINVSPFCHTRSLLFLYSPTDIGVDPHSHSPTSAKNPKTTLNELARYHQASANH